MNQKDKVKRTEAGGRIYEQINIDYKERTDWSSLRITRASTFNSKPTFKERLTSFVALGFR
mgnify:CR=1 FL=1